MTTRIISWRVTRLKPSWGYFGAPDPLSWAPVFADPRPQDTGEPCDPQYVGRRRRHRLCSSAVPLMPYA